MTGVSTLIAKETAALAIAALAAGTVVVATDTSRETKTVSRPPSLATPSPSQRELDRPQVNGRPAVGCGVERWSVKTLTDPGANAVKLSAAVPTTISKLTAIRAPSSPTDRVTPVETTKYKISGILTVAKQEADSDYHLVVQDGSAHMIVELTNPSCARGSIVLPQISSARQTFENRFGVPQRYPHPDLRPNARITVEGVGFFDRIHGQTGVAPNGIELHPVTKITSP